MEGVARGMWRWCRGVTEGRLTCKGGGCVVVVVGLGFRGGQVLFDICFINFIFLFFHKKTYSRLPNRRIRVEKIHSKGGIVGLLDNNKYVGLFTTYG